MGEQRKQKCADELRVGRPYAFARVASFEGQKVDKHRGWSAKQDIVWRRVFQSPAVRKDLLRQVQRQARGAGEHFRRPFGGKTCHRNGLMLAQAILSWERG